MMDFHKYTSLPVAFFGGIVMLLGSAIAQAENPDCGTRLISNTKLDSDMDCPGTALLLTGNKSKKVALNCAGYSISSDTGSVIIASKVSGVTIKNCVIQANDYFSHGVLLANRAIKSVVQNNTITTFGDSSHGISLRDSSDNRIIGNAIHSFGSNDASAMLIGSGSNSNLVQRNTLQSEFSYPLNIESSSHNRIYNNTLMPPNGYVLLRSFALQSGGLGVDASGNLHAVDSNWESSRGIGDATAYFQIDPVTGLANSVKPLLKKGKDVGFGFDALDVLPDNRILVLSSLGSPSALYEINPNTGKVTRILKLPAFDGVPNGLEATGNTSLLATTDEGELLNIDLDTGDVTERGEQATAWADVAVHPSSGKVYAVSQRRPEEIFESVHLYEIDPANGQIITEIGDTGEVKISSIDFAPIGTLYGNSDGRLIEIDPVNASVVWVNSAGFGPDPLERKPRKNKLKDNLFQSDDGSLRFLQTIILPTASELAISSARVEIIPNAVMVDSAVLPFLDEPARITLNNLVGDFHNLLVDSENDGNFDPCPSPQCKFVSYDDGSLVFDVKGFSSYSSEEKTNPSLEFVTAVVRAEIKALLSTPGNSKSVKKFLKAAQEDIVSALTYLKNGNIRKGLIDIGKSVADLGKAKDKGAPTDSLIDHLLEAAKNEAQAAIDAAIARTGDAALIAEAEAYKDEADAELLADKAITGYKNAWNTASKA